MKRTCAAPILLLLLWGCSPPEGGTPNSTSTMAVSNTTTVAVSPTASPSPLAMASPRLPEPDLPSKLLGSYQPVAGLEPKMKDRETWWADSGISDNRLGYYTSNESVAQVEAQLLPAFTSDQNKPYLEGIGPVFDYDGNRVCIMKRGDKAGEQLFVLVPLGAEKTIPKSLLALKLPNIPAAELEGKATLVVLATGEGLGEHVDHMLGQAGLVITPTPTDSPTPGG